MLSLDRPTVTADPTVLDTYREARVAVTGGAGTIGSALCQALVGSASEVTALDQQEYGLYEVLTFESPGIQASLLDVRRPESVAMAWQTVRPTVVFHAAALKHVPLCEDQVWPAVETNILGTHHVAEACRASGAWMVNISTDKAVAPGSVMGRTKRLAEDVATRAGFANVRFANVWNSRGSLLETWTRQADLGRPLTITDPRCTRSFMTVEEAVALVVTVGSWRRPGTFVLDVGVPLSIVELATRFLEDRWQRAPQPDDTVTTGLRRGERLHERWMEDDETLLPTEHAMIREVTRVAP